MTNIRMVSKLAGVSVATVSRALQKPEVVSERTRKKVEEAVREAGYKPNMMARNFRSKKSYAILVLVPDFSNPFFSKVISGIQAAAKAKGYNILLGNTMGDKDLEYEFANLLQTNQADGIIQLSASFPLPADEQSGDNPLPIVNCCECVRDDSMPTVTLDNEGAAEAMVEHLISLGHKRIAAMMGPVDSPLTDKRLSGYKTALQKARLPLDDALLVNGDYTMESGVKAAADLLALETPPTAVFCFNDEMAIGAISHIKQSGQKVPEDIAIAGFDDLDVSHYTDPPLTTIKQPNRRFGAAAIDLLFELMEGKSCSDRHRTLPYELVIRQSTASG